MSEENIKELCLKMAKLLDEGWSVSIARKKVIGCDNSRLNRTVTKHPLYVEMLNMYIAKWNKELEYIYDKDYPKGARLIARKKGSASLIK